MSTAKISIIMNEPLGHISRHIYGHFIEHLGRCIEEGLWVGERSAIPNDNGIRLDVLHALKRIQAPIIRWPGGCFADAYDWRDGIGPRELRPRRINIWWNKEEDNQFGTDEFMHVCEYVGAEPYICANVGSGSPREMMQWLEYCNYAGTTTLAQERARNGHPEPYHVKFWGIGNENWGCGGQYQAADYAHEYRRYAQYLRRLDPNVQLIACGFTHEWNLEFLENVQQLSLVNHLSLHHYYKGGPARGFSEEEYYQLFLHALPLEKMIERDAALLHFFTRGSGHIKLAIDEWGAWHPEAVIGNGHYQENTLRDALCAAMLLDVFNRHCAVISMTNIAQTINVLQCLIQTAEEKMWLTPTYHIYDLYRPHMDARALRTEQECGEAVPGLSQISASASFAADKRSVCVTCSNVHFKEPCEIRLQLIGLSAAASASGNLLTAEDAEAVNGPEDPEAVKPRPLDVQLRGNEALFSLPPCATAALLFQL